MDKNQSIRTKIIFPCQFENLSYGFYPGWFVPYGPGVLTAFLRNHGCDVEQEDLSIRFNRYANYFSVFPSAWGVNLGLPRNKSGIDTFLESGQIEVRLQNAVDRILDSTQIENFDLIGISVFSYFHFLFALVLAKRIKQRFGMPIVFGGPFVSLHGNLYFKSFNFIDYLIVGDGCIPLLKLIHHLEGRISIKEVPNLSYRINGDVMANYCVAQPLEEMPVPDFTDFPLKLYEDTYDLSFLNRDTLLPYQVTRGCANRCSFCDYIHINKKLEFKSYAKVASELSQMKEKYKSKRFFFTDEAINNSYEYLEGLCDALIKSGLDIEWYAFTKVKNLDEHILKKMRKSGCIQLNFGIESGSNRILQMMNKGFVSGEAGRVLKLSYEQGIKNVVFLISGYPYETQEDINQTIEFIRKNKKYYYIFHHRVFELLHGSDMHINPEKYGLSNLSPHEHPIYSFTFDESSELKWEEKQLQQANSVKQIKKALAVCKRLSIVQLQTRIFIKSILCKLRKLCNW